MELVVLIFIMAIIGLACLAFVAILPFAIKELFCDLRRERQFELVLQKREPLSDMEFYQAFYGSSQIDPQVPIRLRRLLARELGGIWLNLHPSDNPAAVYQDLDFADAVHAAETAFGVRFSLAEMRSLDCTFDSLVRRLDAMLRARA